MIIKAIDNNNSSETIKTLIAASGVDVNATQTQYGPLLFYAIRVGAWNSVKALIDAGADVNAVNGNGFTPLFDAVGFYGVAIAHRDGNKNLHTIIKLLLDAGANPRASHAGFSPIDYAKSKYMNGDDGYLDIYQLLIRY